MPLTTTLVTGYLYDPNGDPLANTQVTVRLTKAEVDGNIIVPETVVVTTDALGLFSAPLWPNARGQAGSQYRVTVSNFTGVGSRKLFDRLMTVPDTGVAALADILDTEAPDTKSVSAALRAAEAAEAALAASEEYYNLLVQLAGDAPAEAEAARQYAVDAFDSALAASNSAQIAEDSQAVVTSTAAAVAASELAAAASEAAAQASAAAALLSEQNALLSEQSALSSLTDAQASALAAALSEANAAASAAAAALSASEALVSENAAAKAFLDTVQAIAAGANIYDTRESAIAGIQGMEAGATIIVLKDEGYGGRKTYNRVLARDPVSLDIDFARAIPPDSPSIDMDFASGSFSSGNGFSTSTPYYAIGNGIETLEFIGAEAINLVDTQPASSAADGILGDMYFGAGTLDFHDGTQWYRLTGATF